MEWQIIVALVVAVPVVLFPVAFVWYMNIGGILTAIKEARARRATQKKQVTRREVMPEQEREYNIALLRAVQRYPWNK